MLCFISSVIVIINYGLMTMMIINVMMIIKISIISAAALCGLSIFLKLHSLIIMIINSYHHDHGHHCQHHQHDVHLVMV